MVQVAPFTGAWIEIFVHGRAPHNYYVAPFTGAWIEIYLSALTTTDSLVAPFTGAWIEMLTLFIFVKTQTGRTLHGCVD